MSWIHRFSRARALQDFLRVALRLVAAVATLVPQATAPGQAPVPAPDTLTNQLVIDMVVGKLPKDLIIAKIKSTAARYDITAAGLVALNSAKVPRDVIKLMMDAPLGPVPVRLAAPAESTRLHEVERTALGNSERPSATGEGAASPSGKSAPAKTTSTPAPEPARMPKALLSPLPTESGIHAVATGSISTILERNSFTSGSTSNVLASALTSGLAPVKLKAIVQSGKAALRFADASVEFYFVFDKPAQGGGLSGAGQWWGELSSPNEFTLVRLDAKADRREATVGSFSALGRQTGTESKVVVATTFTRLKTGVYRVMPRAPLAPGEYAFFPASAFGQGTAGANRLFDFGIDVP